MKITRFRLLALAVPVAVILAATAYLALRISGVTQPESAASLPLPSQLKPADFWPDKAGVLHIVSPTTAGSVDKGEAGEVEIWFDPKNMMGRAEHRWADGTIESLEVCRADYYDEYAIGGGNRTDPAHVVQRRLLNGGGWAYWLAVPGQSVAYSGLIEAGEWKATDTTVDNVPALKLEHPVFGDDGKQSSTETVYLDKGTRLPIRFEETDMSGNETGSRALQYKVVEWVPQENVDPKLFELPADLPNVYSRTSETEMTTDEARKFPDFDVYFLGDSFEGRPLSRLRDFSEQSSVAGLNIAVRYFDTQYSTANAKAEERITVTTAMEDKGRADPWNSPGSPTLNLGPKRDVTVGGRAAFLYANQGNSDLWLQIGGSVVDVSGANEDEVTKAGEALAKLN